MNKTVIRKLDNNNFILAEKLSEPMVRIIAGNEVTYEYKNIDKYYGKLGDAIDGLCRHLGKEKINVPNLLYLIRAEDITQKNMVFLEVTYSQIKEIIEK